MAPSKAPETIKVLPEASIKSDALKAFVEGFKKTKPKVTILEFYKHKNHEAWCKCSNCGDWYDRKVDSKCPTCQTKNFKK